MTETHPLFSPDFKPRKVLPYQDEALRKVCDPVPDAYPLVNLFYELERAMSFPQGIGIAAPQIGELVRAFVIRVPHGRGEVKYCIANPEIYWTPKGKMPTAWEGCLSFPGGYRALVARHRHIKVRGIDENREPIQIGGRDMLARVLQHEIDHLDGKLMIDNAVRVDDRSRQRKKTTTMEQTA